MSGLCSQSMGKPWQMKVNGSKPKHSAALPWAPVSPTPQATWAGLQLPSVKASLPPHSSISGLCCYLRLFSSTGRTGPWHLLSISAPGQPWGSPVRWEEPAPSCQTHEGFIPATCVPYMSCCPSLSLGFLAHQVGEQISRLGLWKGLEAMSWCLLFSCSFASCGVLSRPRHLGLPPFLLGLPGVELGRAWLRLGSLPQ